MPNDLRRKGAFRGTRSFVRIYGEQLKELPEGLLTHFSQTGELPSSLAGSVNSPYLTPQSSIANSMLLSSEHLSPYSTVIRGLSQSALRKNPIGAGMTITGHGHNRVCSFLSQRF